MNPGTAPWQNAGSLEYEFFDKDAPKADRERWKDLVTKCRAIIDAEWLSDEAAQIADYRYDCARDERLMAGAK